MADPRLENCLKIHVGPVPADTTEKDLKRHFGRFGQITKVFVRYNSKNRSQMKLIHSSCTILVSDMDTYQQILAANHFFKGRKVKCTKYMEGEELDRYNKESNERRIIIKNIPNDVKFPWLESIVKPYGEIDFLYFLHESNPNSLRRYNNTCQTASLQFTFKASALKLLEKRNYPLGNTKIKFQKYDHNFNQQRSTPYTPMSLSGGSSVAKADINNKYEYQEKTNQDPSLMKKPQSKKVFPHYLKPTLRQFYTPERKLNQEFSPPPTNNIRFNINVTDLQIIVEAKTRRAN